MAYALISSYGKAGRSISAACAVLRGYHRAYPLLPEERRHLRLLVACRLALSFTMGSYTHKQNPENEYILFHAEPAWRALRLVWGDDGRGERGAGDSIDRAFEVACGGTPSSSGADVPDCEDISFPDPSIADPLASVRVAAPRGGGDERKVTFVTGNKKKLEEVRRILSVGGDLPFDLVSEKIDLPELQGDPAHVAREKCALAVEEVGGACIVEDTSLCFGALGGMPGVYVKWFLDSCGLDGLCDLIASKEDKSAYAQTVVAYCPGPGGEVRTFAGRTTGRIVRPRGCRDFGWDPIFEPDEGGGMTYAEMTGEGKDAISHRKRAFVMLRDYIGKEQAAAAGDEK